MNHISASPHPQIKSEVHLTIRESADYFRDWVKTDFSRWHRREFQKHYLNPDSPVALPAAVMVG